MIQDIPNIEPNKIFEIPEFLGVDFTSSPIEIDKRRSPNAYNIIKTLSGKIETRPGYEVLENIGVQINGVWNIDTNLGDLFLVHAGTKLYQYNDDFTLGVEILTGMTNSRSTGLYIAEYLVIFDGTRTVIFGKYGESYEAKFLDTAGYIPTSSVLRDKSGGGTSYEPFNLMSPYAINTFLPETWQIETGETDPETTLPVYEDVHQTEFLLDQQNIVSVKLVEVLNNEGNWVIKQEGTDYIVDLNAGKITFTQAPGPSPVLGEASIRVRYEYDNTEGKTKINKCTIATLYGYEGNNNRIFASGNPDSKNYDYHCEQDDPTYWPDEYYTKFGTEPIMSYTRLNDGTLAIQKKHSDTDCTVYYRDYNLMNDKEIFPIKDGVKNIGCISKYCNANLRNDPLTLTEEGIDAIVGSGTNNEKFAMQRSYYINEKLLKEQNLEKASAIVVDGKYYLAVNDHIYILDSRYLSYPKNAKTEQFNYECFYWTNVPARVLFSWNNKLYFGTSDGKICKFNDTYLNDNIPVISYWETPFLNLNSDNLVKTIKMITLILNPTKKCDLKLSYKLEDGTVEVITKKYDEITNDFPKIIQENEKINKFMFVKFIIENNTANYMTFEKLILEYVYSGKYRGE